MNFKGSWGVVVFAAGFEALSLFHAISVQAETDEVVRYPLLFVLIGGLLAGGINDGSRLAAKQQGMYTGIVAGVIFTILAWQELSTLAGESPPLPFSVAIGVTWILVFILVNVVLSRIGFVLSERLATKRSTRRS